jgi:RNA polymerase sigma factor (sigma-70 family)
VKDVPGTLRAGGAAFVTTHWSVIAASLLSGASDDADTAQIALAQLCRDYWPPLYSFVRRRGYSAADAQDLVQDFFVHLLETKAYARTQPAKGKFRTFLLVSLKNYLADAWDRARAFKRGGGCQFVLLDEEKLDAVEAWSANESAALAALTEDQHYEQRWAAALVGRALDRVEGELQTASKAHVFRGLKPFLSGGVNLPTQEEVARDLEMPLDTLRSHLSRLRARYRTVLRDEVARTIAAVDNVDEELRHLRGILASAF